MYCLKLTPATDDPDFPLKEITIPILAIKSVSDAGRFTRVTTAHRVHMVRESITQIHTQLIAIEKALE